MDQHTLPAGKEEAGQLAKVGHTRCTTIGAKQYYVYRCRIGEETRDVLAVDADHAREQTGADTATELCQWPIPMLDDMRANWEELKKTREGIYAMQKWMCAAVRMELIDTGQFEKMAVAVEQAKEVLG